MGQESQTEKILKERFPQDAIMLASAVNTQLRDYYSSLDAFCEDLGIDKKVLISKLGEAGFEYLPQINQFR